jgi:hypothetical protein
MFQTVYVASVYRITYGIHMRYPIYTVGAYIYGHMPKMAVDQHLMYAPTVRYIVYIRSYGMHIPYA